MKKSHCGVVHFTDEEEDLLFVVGGYAPDNAPTAFCDQHIQDVRARTNEQHVFYVSTSECIQHPSY